MPEPKSRSDYLAEARELVRTAIDRAADRGLTNPELVAAFAAESILRERPVYGANGGFHRAIVHEYLAQLALVELAREPELPLSEIEAAS